MDPLGSHQEYGVLSRRQLLMLFGLGATTAIAPTSAKAQVSSVSGSSTMGSSKSGWVLGTFGQGTRGDFLAGDLQVLTVTETSVTISWNTWDANISPAANPEGLPTQGTLRVWPAGDPDRAKEVHSAEDRIFHLLTVDGLKPETTYHFAATSHGIEATATHNYLQESRHTFTTLPQLAGTVLATIVVANDVHIGETQDGIIVGNFPPPATANPHVGPYPEICLNAIIDNAHAVGASHLFINGDLTSEARPHEVARAQELLGRFKGQVRVTRGNHDRAHKADGATRYETCAPLTTRTFDCFGEVFEPHQRAWVEHIPGANARVVGIDSTALDSSGGEISSDQFDQIEAILGDAPDLPTVLMLHHPTTHDAARSNYAGPGFVLRDGDLMRLQSIVAKASGVRLVLSGHTHRARRNRPDVATHAVFLECAAAKNWPSGALQLRFYSNGIAVTYLHNDGAGALDWTTRTRWTYFGLAPELLLGPTDARNLVVRY